MFEQDEPQQVVCIQPCKMPSTIGESSMDLQHSYNCTTITENCEAPLNIKQGGQSTCRLKINIAAHNVAVVGWLNTLANYLPKISTTNTASSLIPLLHMCHWELKGLTKVFMTTLNSFQIHDLQSAKICHLDCLFRITMPYNFITESAIKKRSMSIPLFTVCDQFSMVY